MSLLEICTFPRRPRRKRKSKPALREPCASVVAGWRQAASSMKIIARARSRRPRALTGRRGSTNAASNGAGR
jgi:hypothetical protein